MAGADPDGERDEGDESGEHKPIDETFSEGAGGIQGAELFAFLDRLLVLFGPDECAPVLSFRSALTRPPSGGFRMIFSHTHLARQPIIFKTSCQSPCTITLQHNTTDRRLIAQIDDCQKKATAAIQLFSPGRMFTITDRNTADSRCSCN
jgi:hypothetical protein